MSPDFHTLHYLATNNPDMPDKAHKTELIDVSEPLLERENMDGSEIRAMIFPEEATAATEEEPTPGEGNVVAPVDGPRVDEP